MSRPFIFFDVGGTLLHLRPSLAHAIAGSCRDLGFSAGDDQVARAVELALGRVGPGPHATDLDENRRWWFELYGHALGAIGHGEQIDHLARALWARHRAGDWLLPAEDTRPTLEALATAGVRMGVISNWDDTLEAVLVRRGLRDLFEFTLASADLGRAKPDRAIFEHALRLAAIEPADAFHVGDDPVTDVAGALGAGIRPILLGSARPLESAPPYATIGRLGELLQVIGH